MKTFFINLFLILLAAVLTAAMVIIGNNYINAKYKTEGVTHFSFFGGDKGKEINLQFVEIKSLVITLKSSEPKERYLLLDLALSTQDEQQSLMTENLLPKIKGITVDILSSMDYNEVRNMSIIELRQLMLERYKSAFSTLNVTIPFKDVIISKMVFQ